MSQLFVDSFLAHQKASIALAPPILGFVTICGSREGGGLNLLKLHDGGDGRVLVCLAFLLHLLKDPLFPAQQFAKDWSQRTGTIRSLLTLAGKQFTDEVLLSVMLAKPCGMIACMCSIMAVKIGPLLAWAYFQNVRELWDKTCGRLLELPRGVTQHLIGNGYGRINLVTLLQTQFPDLTPLLAQWADTEGAGKTRWIASIALAGASLFEAALLLSKEVGSRSQLSTTAAFAELWRYVVDDASAWFGTAISRRAELTIGLDTLPPPGGITRFKYGNPSKPRLTHADTGAKYALAQGFAESHHVDRDRHTAEVGNVLYLLEASKKTESLFETSQCLYTNGDGMRVIGNEIYGGFVATLDPVQATTTTPATRGRKRSTS